MTLQQLVILRKPEQTYLRAKRSLFMEVAAHKITVLACGHTAFPMDADAAWVANDLTCHVFRRVDLLEACNSLSADGPACYVIWPLMRGN